MLAKCVEHSHGWAVCLQEIAVNPYLSLVECLSTVRRKVRIAFGSGGRIPR